MNLLRILKIDKIRLNHHHSQHFIELQLQKQKDREEMGMESHLTYHYVKITHDWVRMFARVCNIVFLLVPSFTHAHTHTFLSSFVAVIIGRLNWIVADVWIVHEMKDLLWNSLLSVWFFLPNINKHFWVFFFHFICFMLGYTPIFLIHCMLLCTEKFNVLLLLRQLIFHAVREEIKYP